MGNSNHSAGRRLASTRRRRRRRRELTGVSAPDPAPPTNLILPHLVREAVWLAGGFVPTWELRLGGYVRMEDLG